MAITIPSNQDIPITMHLPVGFSEWPGPPTWTTSTPNYASITLIEGSGQKNAILRTLCPVTVTVFCPNMLGHLDFLIDDSAPIPSTPPAVMLNRV